MMNKFTRKLARIPDEVRTKIELYFSERTAIVDEDNRKLPNLPEDQSATAAKYVRPDLFHSPKRPKPSPSPALPSGSPLPPPPMDVSAVHAALSDKSYSDLAPLCDELFLQAASRGAATDDWPYAVHLLAHLYLNDLNSARFLWKSLPQEVKDARPELAAVWRIGQCLWNRDYALVYTATQGFEWGPELADFVTAFLESYRKRIFQLLTSAYSTISVADVAHFMGMSEEDATNYAVQNGWSLDAATKMLTVKKPKVQTNQKLDASKLQRLTECVFHLEH